MGIYERIRTDDDDDYETKTVVTFEKNTVRDVTGKCKGEGNDDVEMAMKDSESRGISGSVAGAGDKFRQLLPVKKEQPLPPPQQQRLVSLDVFRGLSVALMILVDHVGGIFPPINHSPWNGLTLADFVMPFFLFIVGVSLALAYKKSPGRAPASRKAILRALKLFFLGLFLQGGYFHGVGSLTYGVDINQIRWMGILQRIAIAYLVAALCEIWLKGDDDVHSTESLLKKYRLQWVVGLVLTTVYISLLYGLYVSDWEYQIPTVPFLPSQQTFTVKCNVRGDTGPACNVVGMIDRKILRIQHLYRKAIYARTKQCSINSPDYGPLAPNAPSWCQAPFDPEGILSSVMAIVTCLVGLHYGHIIVHFKHHGDRLSHWLIASSCLIIIGLVLEFCGMHVNKALYTCSYMCVTVGVAGIIFVGIYLMVDFFEHRRLFVVLEWIGMHALMIFILATTNVLPVLLQGFYWRSPKNNILSLLGIGR